MINPENEVYRFFEGKPDTYAPENRKYFLKSLEKDKEGRPTNVIKVNNRITWDYRQALGFTKLCLAWDVPDVEQRITGNVFDLGYYGGEIPESTA